MFLTAQWLLRHTGSSGFARVFDYDLYRTVAGKFSIGGLDIVKLTKTPLNYRVSRFNLGGLGALFGGLSAPNPSLRGEGTGFVSENASLLCMFVPPPTVPLHKVVNSGFFLWAWSLFLYFRSMSGLSCSWCRWPELNNIVRNMRSHDFVRPLSTRRLIY